MFDIQRQTQRLLIRPVTLRDYVAFVSGFRNCAQSRNRFDEQFDTTEMTMEWYEALIKRREDEAARDYAYKFQIFDKSETFTVGYCNIYPHYREDFQYGHIGYAIHNNFWGNGYATECVAALITIGFEELNLHRLEAHVNLDNPASKRVLFKTGFAFEGIRRAFILEDGVWTDNEIYSVNNAAWRAK